MATSQRSELLIHIPPLKFFTATELRAAEQLVQLSESSAECSAATEESSCSFSTSNTPLSGCAKPFPLVSIEEHDDDDDDDDDDDMGGKRRHRRYRLVSDLYEATTPIDGDKKKWNG